LKSRILITPNIRTNEFDIDFIKRALLETENDEQFGLALEERNDEFTKVHKMEIRRGDEDIYEIMKKVDASLNQIECNVGTAKLIILKEKNQEMLRSYQYTWKAHT
jgi:hypothetical protein